MKILFVAAVWAVLLTPAIVEAQSSSRRTDLQNTAEDDPEISLGQLTPTPEMWFYEQALRQYRDPKVSVRRRAAFEADQRQARLAAQRWFGYSTSRPTANITPFMTNYSPAWTGNSLFPGYPGNWRGTTKATIVVPAQAARPAVGYGLW